MPALFKFGLSAAPPARDFLDSSRACIRGPFLIRGKYRLTNPHLPHLEFQDKKKPPLKNDKGAVHVARHIKCHTLKEDRYSLETGRDQNSLRDFVVRASQRTRCYSHERERERERWRAG